MTPANVIIWACVAIFVATAILTLLHISGIRTLPNADHGKILFRALIIEVVAVAVGVFASTLLPGEAQPGLGTLPGSMASESSVFSPPAGDANNPSVLLPSSQGSNGAFPFAPPPDTTGDDCYQVTVSDGSTFPPTTRIETLCN